METLDKKAQIELLERKKKEIKLALDSLNEEYLKVEINIRELNYNVKQNEIVTIQGETFRVDFGDYFPRLYKVRGDWESKMPKLVYGTDCWEEFIKGERPTPFR